MFRVSREILKWTLLSIPNKSASGGARKLVETRACQRALLPCVPAAAESTVYNIHRRRRQTQPTNSDQ